MRTLSTVILTLALGLAASGPGSARGASRAEPPQQAPSAAPQKAAAADKTAQADTISVPLRFDRYYSYEQVVEALKSLNAAFPDFTKLDLVGRSEENREIWAMTLNNPKTGAPLSKPGVYLDGNIHGNEIQAGEVCLYFLNALLTGYGRNESITRLVDRNAYYVIPVVNVDGRYHFFHDANDPSSNRSLRIPIDDDHDGLLDEDPADDLDGDGNICMMRRKDPFGQLRTDPEEPRLMVRVKPGEKGEWTNLGEEGIDNDNDGRVNEDGEGYVDGNRNWGYNWAPPYVQSGSGMYPFQGLGIRAIANYIMDRPNIIAVYAFHNSGGMYLRGPSVKTEEPMNRSDVAVYDILGQNAEKIVPGYRYLVAWKDLYATYGDFTDFTYNLAGAYSFVGELFQSETETYRAPGAKEPTPPEMGDFGGSPQAERERLKFSDNVTQGALFKPWKPFKHPQFGDIEIGGWVKMSSRLPHPFMLTDLVHRNASAVMFAASQTPQITMDIISQEKAGTDLYKIRVQLANGGGLPTRTFQAVQKKNGAPDILKASGPAVKVVAGGIVTDPSRLEVSYKPRRPEVQFVHVPGYGKTEFLFLISGKGDVTFSFASLKAGAVERTVTLR